MATPEPPTDVTRRHAAGLAALGGMAAAGPARAAPQNAGSGRPRITCFIRYQIDPYQKAAFAAYAEAWGRIIPRCGGHLVGYFLPDEGTNDIAFGLIAFDSLAAYEAYRARLRTDEEARRNFAFAQARKFVLREERSFLEIAEGTFEVASAGP